MPIYCQPLSQYLEILCAWLGTAVPVPQDWVGLQSQSEASPSKPQELQSQSRPGPSDPARTAVPVPPPRGQTGRQSQSRTGTVCVLALQPLRHPLSHIPRPDPTISPFGHPPVWPWQANFGYLISSLAMLLESISLSWTRCASSLCSHILIIVCMRRVSVVAVSSSGPAGFGPA